MAAQGAEERAGEESVIIVSRRQPVKSHQITAISHTGRCQREEPALTDATRRRCQGPRRRTRSRGLLLIKEACCAIVLSICTLPQQHTFAVFPFPGKNGFFALGPKVTLHFSFTLHSHTFSFSLSLSRPFGFIFLTFFLFFFFLGYI